MFDKNGKWVPYDQRPQQSPMVSAMMSGGTSAPLYDLNSISAQKAIQPTKTLETFGNPADDLDFDRAQLTEYALENDLDLGLVNDNTGNTSGFMNNLLGDKYMMSNITGLASTLMQAAALPSMLKNAKLQNKSLAFNLDTAKEEQARRNQNIASFNAPRTANPATERKISAFA